MHYRALAGASLFALLGACQSEDELPENGVVPEAQEDVIVQNLPALVVPDDDRAQPSTPVEEGNSAAKAPQPGKLPPAGGGPRFVGLWASDAQSCASRAWRFTADSLRTPAGSVCRFSSVSPVPGGYDIAARCTAEGPETADAIEIRFAESAQAMLFESGAIADAGLIYCGSGG